MAKTYEVKLYAGGPFVRCESKETVPLSEYGYTDEEWDELSDNEKSNLLEEWGESFLWSEGYEYGAEII